MQKHHTHTHTHCLFYIKNTGNGEKKKICASTGVHAFKCIIAKLPKTVFKILAFTFCRPKLNVRFLGKN